MTLILNDIVPVHWAVAGGVIGLITLLLLWTTNTRLGISTTFENLCSLGSGLPYFRRAALQGPGRWRFPFAAGLLLAGVVSAVLSGGWSPTWDMGVFDTAIGWGALGKLAWTFVGGLAIGVGTRIAGGCTSGHGIFGISNLERASWTSVVVFMLFGILTSNLIYRFLF